MKESVQWMILGTIVAIIGCGALLLAASPEILAVGLFLGGVGGICTAVILQAVDK